VYGFGLAVPAISEENGEYLGMLVAAFPSMQFFERYGNVVEAGSQRIVAVDKSGNYLASGLPGNVGKNVFSDEIQEQTSHNQELSAMYSNVISGNPSSALFVIEGVERYATTYPVYYSDEQVASVVLSTPLTVLYSQVDDILYLQRIQTFAMLAAVVGATLALSLYQWKWNRNLDKKVQERTVDLGSRTEELQFSNDALKSKSEDLERALNTIEESNRQLAQTNEELKIHDRLQREFVNVAAHELRTPIQPLLAAAELIETQFEDREKIEVTRPEIEMILRNAKRIERLSSDILEVSRIESGALKLNTETFSLAYIIAESVKDAKSQSTFDPDRLSITYYPDDIFVHADREKITQVITNFLTNAIKFTKEGTITISTQRAGDGSAALIEVRDSGPGIDAEIEPKLFEKFITKSEKGTGIGLYISKKIVEAHGGKIFGANNLDGPGATFKFTLPLVQKDRERTHGPGTHRTDKRTDRR
jgi:signal transduction histidine kinase